MPAPLLNIITWIWIFKEVAFTLMIGSVATLESFLAVFFQAKHSPHYVGLFLHCYLSLLKSEKPQGSRVCWEGWGYANDKFFPESASEQIVI